MTMLYLCRHAIAADGTGDLPDAERSLTLEGMRKFRKGARGLVAFVGVKAIGHILTSPLLRARQTAEILAEVLTEDKRAVAVVVSEALGPGGRIEALVKEVRGFKGEAGVVAVGHEPMLSEWIGVLCCGGGRARVEMKKGAVAALEMAESGASAELRWLLPPGALRQMAG